MKGAKFKMGQKVRSVNDSQATTVIGITNSGGFHYDVEHYNGNVVHRIAEGNLVPFKKGK